MFRECARTRVTRLRGTAFGWHIMTGLLNHEKLKREFFQKDDQDASCQGLDGCAWNSDAAMLCGRTRKNREHGIQPHEFTFSLPKRVSTVTLKCSSKLSNHAQKDKAVRSLRLEFHISRIWRNPSRCLA